MIGSIEREICSKMLRNFEWKTLGKFSLSTLGYSMVGISCLDDALSEVSPVEVRQPQQKIRKEEKEKARKQKNTKTLRCGSLSQKFHLCVCPRKNVIKRDASGEKAMLSCYKCLFLRRLEISILKMSKMSKKKTFLPKISWYQIWVNGMTIFFKRWVLLSKIWEIYPK